MHWQKVRPDLFRACEFKSMQRKSKNIQVIVAALIAIINSAILKAAEDFECKVSPMNSQDAITNWLKKCATSPTNSKNTLIRDPDGLFCAPRLSGTPHQGVDIKLKLNSSNECMIDTRKYSAKDLAVRAVASGKVAYSRLNNGSCPKGGCPPDRDPLSTTGLGLTVIIDHGNGLYSLYAHLAQDRNTIQCLPDSEVLTGETMPHKVGDCVEKGEIIGYIGQLGSDLEKWDRPTGNATQTTDPAQIHFEIFQTNQGKSSTGSIKDIIDPSNRGVLDPSDFLKHVLGLDPPTYTTEPACRPLSTLNAPTNLRFYTEINSMNGLEKFPKTPSPCGRGRG